MQATWALIHDGVPLTPRMAGEIEGRARRLIKAFPGLDGIIIRVFESPGRYAVSLTLAIENRLLQIEGRENRRATLAISQAFRAVKRGILRCRGFQEMDTAVYLKTEREAKVVRAKRRERERRRQVKTPMSIGR